MKNTSRYLIIKGYRLVTQILILTIFLSCTSSHEKISDFSYDLKPFKGSIHLYMNSDSIYLIALYRNYGGIDDDIFPVSAGTYKKDSKRILLNDIFSGETIILTKHYKSIIPQNGTFKNISFIQEENSLVRENEPAFLDRINDNYEKTLIRKTQIDKIIKSTSLLDSISATLTYHFQRNNFDLYLYDDKRYALKFEELDFSSGVWSFKKGILNLSDTENKTAYSAFLLNDTTLIPGNFPFSAYLNTMQLE